MITRSHARLAAVVLALSAVQVSPAAAANKVVEAAKIYSHYDGYLKLPPAERSHFVMAYYLRLGTQPLTAPVWLVDGDKRTPIPLRADGRILKFPTLAQLSTAKVEIGVDDATKIGEAIGLEPTLAPAAELDARELAAAVAQAGPGMKKIAGVMAFALPAPKAVIFVGAPSAEAELADGRRVALPLVKGSAAYDPAAIPNATRIRLPKLPQKLDID